MLLCTESLRLAFYYPMLGLINIFILILKAPAATTASSDLALLDIAAGHFAHMEFMTSSELAFPFTREVADLARQTVKRVRDQHLIHINDEASWNDRIWANASVDYWNNVSCTISHHDPNFIKIPTELTLLPLSSTLWLLLISTSKVGIHFNLTGISPVKKYSAIVFIPPQNTNITLSFSPSLQVLGRYEEPIKNRLLTKLYSASIV